MECSMKVELAKWGNSAALRVPSGAVQDAGWHIGQVLNLRAEAGRIVVEAAPETLEDLIARITPQNLHGIEFEEDASRGVEVW
jgi:antitoxin MazE